MEEKNKNSEPSGDNIKNPPDPTNRDFQRTEEDIDNISASEKEELDERTERGNTKPDKEKIN